MAMRYLITALIMALLLIPSPFAYADVIVDPPRDDVATERLIELAKKRTNLLNAGNKLRHTSYEELRTYLDVCSWLGENLFMVRNVEVVEALYMASPAHRFNLLHERTHHIRVTHENRGLVYGTDLYCIATDYGLTPIERPVILKFVLCTATDWRVICSI